jgi:hypothetical protein
MLWLKGKRPRKPRNWDTDVKESKERAEQWAQGNLKVEKKEDAFKNLWSDHKVTFSRKHHRKCGYCETSVQADSDGGTIDHYRPKAEVSELGDDPTTWGAEVDGHNSRDRKKQRQKAKSFPKGYHWLAYDWDNYVFSCGTCNAKWKGTLFPIQGGHNQAPSEASHATEVPLLLNPYGDIDPAEHLEFNDIGQIDRHNGSEIGFETIKTFGLACEGLRQLRAFTAHVAMGHIRKLREELTSKDQPLDEVRLRRASQDVLRMGGSKQPYAGMVRALWVHKSRLPLSWEKLRELHNKLR